MHNYRIYLAIRRGFPLFRMSTNNQISPLQFCCNTSIPFLNNPKCLNLSSKTDLDFWNCFGRKITPSYNRRNMVYFENKTPQKVFENSKPKTGLIVAR